MAYVRAIQGPGFSVIYTDSQGNKFLFSGGSWAWRNHNPGNIRSGHITKGQRQIGIVFDQRREKLAVFSNKQKGYEALEALMKTERYQNKTLDEAIATYAPPKENNTKAYQNQVRERLKLPGTFKVKDLTSDQFQVLLKEIEKIEGWEEGTIEPLLKIEAVERNSHGVIQGYYCHSTWYSKKAATELVLQGKLDALSCHTAKGKSYLRASSGNPPLHALPNKKREK